MDLKDCEDKGFIRKIIPNFQRAESLIKISDIKEIVVQKIVLDKTNINAYFPMAYDSLRESMEAICIQNGYKVTNHICIGELLKKIYVDFDLVLFDRLRYARNSINYYGETIDINQGKLLILEIFKMRKEIKKLFRK